MTIVHNQIQDHLLVLAELSATQSDVTGDDTGYKPIFDTEILDVGGDYDNTTGIFTAPQAGYYRHDIILSFEDITASHTRIVVLFNATTNGKRVFEANLANLRDDVDRCVLILSWTTAMANAETASMLINVANGTKVVDFAVHSGSKRVPQWSITKLG